MYRISKHTQILFTSDFGLLGLFFIMGCPGKTTMRLKGPESEDPLKKRGNSPTPSARMGSGSDEGLAQRRERVINRLEKVLFINFFRN